MKWGCSSTFACALALVATIACAESEYDRLYKELAAADVAADAAWDTVKTPSEYAARKQELRKKMIAGIGGLFQRCPLNAQIVGTVPRDGYRVEKLMFETLPGIHVTALAFVPDSEKFKAPYPAVAVTCGHAFEGKADPGYQRACVMGAKEGFLMLIYDPFGQGERVMGAFSNCAGHNNFEAFASRLGRSTAAFRIWDGMRVLDYLQSRPDVKPDRLGLMGNSGGGTMTSLIMALDPRLKAAAPSCYISSMRDVVRSIGPQDAEQCLYGQLRDGINHASLVLMADAAVRLQFAKRDFFPNRGSVETLAVVRRTADRLGIGDRYSSTTNPGEHGWREASRRSSLDWMRQWLMDEKPNGKTDADYSSLDLAFDANKADMGLSKKDSNVTPRGSVKSVKGERNFYDYLIDELIGAKTPRLVFCDEEGARHGYYGSISAAEENAVIARMLGKSLISERRDRIIAEARKMADKKPMLIAYDSWERAASQAYAEHPELFAGFKPLGDGFSMHAERETRASVTGMPAGLRPCHPRMFFNEDTWPAVKARADGPARAERDSLIARCRAYTDNPVCTCTERVTTGPAIPITNVCEFGAQAVECALAWRFTGEKVFLEKTKKMLLANVRGYREAYGNRRAVNWYSNTRILSLCAYDWIFEALTPDERRAIIVPLVEHVENIQPRKGGPFITRRDTGGIETGFYGVYSLLWYSGLAAAGDGFCDELAAKHLAEGEKLFRDLLKLRNDAAGDDGGMPSGVPVYAICAYPWSQFNFLHTYLSAFGENLALKYPGLSLLPNWIWWSWINTRDDFREPAEDGFGDCYHEFNEFPVERLYEHLAQQIFFYREANHEATRLAAGIAALLDDKRLATPFGPNGRGQLDWPMYPFILDPLPPDVKPCSPAELCTVAEKSRYFERLGQFKLRSGWTADSTYASFTAGAAVRSHKHYDENSFTIAKHGFLAIDSGTRAVETDCSLRHYYSQTVAHNCILIDKPGEPFPVHWGLAYSGPEGKTNDGGQYGGSSAKVLGYETDGDFTYIASDAANCYGKKCREAVRQFVHIQPDVFVVYDRVNADAAWNQRWLLHTVNEPQITDGTIRADCRKGRLFSQTLLPEGAKIGKVGGPGMEYWSNGKNWDIDKAYAEPVYAKAKERGYGPYFGSWRVEVSPSVSAATNRFLHVLTATDTSVRQGAVAKRLTDTTRDGVELKLPDGRAVTVWFNRYGKVGGEIAIVGKSRPFATSVQKQSGVTATVSPTKFKPIQLNGLEPRPDFWKVRPEEIIALCNRAKKPSRKEVICHTPLGYPVHALFYGDFSELPPQSNWSAGSSSRNYRSYFGDRKDGKQTILFLAGIHGSEPECVAGAVNLIQMLETGKDFRGKTDAALLDLIGKYRLIIVPCVNMDGRAISPDHLRGIGWHDFRAASQGTWKDGSLIGWRGSKDYFPLPLDHVAYPGGYPNADGFNIMHDATPGNVRTAEARSLIRLCERWRVDAVLNGHSYELSPSVLSPCYGPTAVTSRALDIQLACNRAIKGEGLTDWRFDRNRPTETHNLNALFTMASGALALTLECSVSWKGRQDDPAKAPEPYSFDELMQPVYTVLRTMMSEGMKKPFVVRGNEQVLAD